MLRYLLQRLLVLIPTFLGITLLTFSLIRLIPGDPVEVMMGERTLDPELHAAALQKLGLDQPLYVQYGRYLADLASGNLGNSLKTQASVWTEFKALFPATLELALCALLIALVFGLIAGVLAAVRRGTWLDHSVMTAALTGYSMPIFWWGLLLILIFSVGLGWTPVSGRLDLVFDVQPQTGFMLIDAWLAERADPELNSGAFLDAVAHLILPAIVLGTIPLAVIARMTRSSMLEVLREDYVRTARAKGLSPLRVIFVHTLRNALIPVLTVQAMYFAALLGGALVTEIIFAWPGIGRLAVQAIQNRDFPLVQAVVLLASTVFVLANLMVDIAYVLLNPRIRL